MTLACKGKGGDDINYFPPAIFSSAFFFLLSPSQSLSANSFLSPPPSLPPPPSGLIKDSPKVERGEEEGGRAGKDFSAACVEEKVFSAV